jgi:hypothetical protein
MSIKKLEEIQLSVHTERPCWFGCAGAPSVVRRVPLQWRLRARGSSIDCHRDTYDMMITAGQASHDRMQSRVLSTCALLRSRREEVVTAI